MEFQYKRKRKVKRYTDNVNKTHTQISDDFGIPFVLCVRSFYFFFFPLLKMVWFFLFQIRFSVSTIRIECCSGSRLYTSWRIDHPVMAGRYIREIEGRRTYKGPPVSIRWNYQPPPPPPICDELDLLFFILQCVLVCAQENSAANGKKKNDSNVLLSFIYSIVKQDGHVQCKKEICPSTGNCYVLQQNKSAAAKCCQVCKGKKTTTF